MTASRTESTPLLRLWTLFLSVTIVWGTAFVFTRLALEDLSPALLVASRVMLAALALNGVRMAARLRLPREAKLWASFVPLALTGTILPFLLVSWGQEVVPSGLAGMLMAFAPLAAVGIAHFAVDGERLTETRLVGAFLGLLGVVVLLGPENLLGLGTRDMLPRQLAILAAAGCYAGNTILVRRLPSLHPLVYGSGVMIVACVFSLPLVLTSLDTVHFDVGLAGWTSIAWLGLVPTGLATLLHYRLVQRAGAGFAALTNYVTPVVALLSGAAVFGEPISLAALGGLALILLGVATVRRGDDLTVLARRADTPPRSVHAQPIPVLAGGRPVPSDARAEASRAA